MASFKVRQAAEDDLVSIGVESTRSWGRELTDRYIARFDAAFKTLASMPLMGSACDDVRPGLRRWVVGAHVIFYRVDHSGDVDIIRVLHARQDVLDHLSAAEDEG